MKLNVKPAAKTLLKLNWKKTASRLLKQPLTWPKAALALLVTTATSTKTLGF
jgi:hypothetical protein